jgi:hypothetical protein
MSIESTIWLFQLVAVFSLTMWMAVAVMNNLQGFHASVGAIGTTMGMSLLRDPLFEKLPFLQRAITNTQIHRLALLGTAAIQLISTAALFVGTLLLAAVPMTPAPASVVAILNLGLCAFTLCWCLMFISGLWFAFWIKQEGLLLTQLLLALWGLLNFVVFNLPLMAGSIN